MNGIPRWPGGTLAEDEPLDDLDDAILAALAHGWQRRDPVPAGLGDRVRFALSLAAVQAEAQALLLQAASDVLVRGSESEPETTDLLTFAGGRVELMIRISRDGWAPEEGVVLDGWVSGTGWTVELCRPGGTITQSADAAGRVTFRGVAPGPAYFAIRPVGGGSPVVTPIVQL